MVVEVAVDKFEFTYGDSCGQRGLMIICHQALMDNIQQQELSRRKRSPKTKNKANFYLIIIIIMKYY